MMAKHRGKAAIGSTVIRRIVVDQFHRSCEKERLGLHVIRSHTMILDKGVVTGGLVFHVGFWLPTCLSLMSLAYIPPARDMN